MKTVVITGQVMFVIKMPKIDAQALPEGAWDHPIGLATAIQAWLNRKDGGEND